MSFLSMRGQTLFVGNLVGEGTGIDFPTAHYRRQHIWVILQKELYQIN